MKTKLISLFVLLLMAVFISACGTPASSASSGEVVSALATEEATSIVENAMQGFKNGDYAAWSRDWSDTMKAGIPEDAFLAYREQVMAQYGDLVSVEAVEILPGTVEGYVRWSVVASFEKGQVRFSFAFPSDGKMIEGVFPEAVE